MESRCLARLAWGLAAALVAVGSSHVWAQAEGDDPAVEATAQERQARQSRGVEQIAAQAQARQRERQSIEQIIVTASPLGRSADELATPINILSRDDLTQSGGATLGEALSLEPGVTNSSFAAGASRPVIRGQDSFRVRVMENGIGTHDVSDLSPDHAVPVNPLTVQRLEVIRGPATLRYGGGAIAGAVNALTNRVPTILPDRLITGEVFSSYGFDARQRDLAGTLDGRIGSNVAWHFDAFSRDTTDYDIPGSPDEQTFTDTDTYSFSGGVSWITDISRVGVSLSKYDTFYGIPDPEGPDATPADVIQGLADPADLTPDDLSIDLRKSSLGFEADLTPTSGLVRALRLRGSRSRYRHNELSRREEVTSEFNNDELEARTELVHEPIGLFEGAIGVQYQDRTIDAGGEGGDLLPGADLRSFAFFFFEEVDVSDRLRLEFGGRLERTRIEGKELDGVTDTKDTYTPLSASFATIYDISDPFSIGLTLSATERAPDPIELFAQGPHDATETFEFGNPDADEEASYTADLRLQYQSEWGFEAEISAFYTDYNDFIFSELTGRSIDEDQLEAAEDLEAQGIDPGPLTFRNDTEGELRELIYRQLDATFIGGEIQVSSPLTEIAGISIGLEGQLDFVRARLSSGRGGNVPRIPPLRVGGALTFGGDRWSGRLGFLRASAQDDIGRFENRTSGYTTVDGNLRVPIYNPLGSERPPIELVLTVRNLLDERVRNHVSFKKDGVLQPGRSIRAGAQFRF